MADPEPGFIINLPRSAQRPSPTKLSLIVKRFQYTHAYPLVMSLTHPQVQYESAIRDFKTKLAQYTMQAQCGRLYVLVWQLTNWLKSKRPETETTCHTGMQVYGGVKTPYGGVVTKDENIQQAKLSREEAPVDAPLPTQPKQISFYGPHIIATNLKFYSYPLKLIKYSQRKIVALLFSASYLSLT